MARQIALDVLDDISIAQKDTLMIMKIKVQISEIIAELMQSDLTRTRWQVVGKFFQMECKLTKFILLEQRDELVRANLPEEISVKTID